MRLTDNMFDRLYYLCSAFTKKLLRKQYVYLNIRFI